MMHNICFWNIRGLNLPSKQSEVKFFIHSKNIQLMCLSETKLDLSLTSKAMSFISPRLEFDHNLADVAFGRLLTLWNPQFYCLTKLSSSDQYIHFKCVYLPSNFVFFLTSVYSHNASSLRLAFLNNICHINPLGDP